MNKLLKKIFCRKEDKAKNAEEVEKPEDLLPFTIPAAVETSTAIPEHLPEHDEFSVICRDKDGVLHRLKSSQSKEVFQMKCAGHHYKFGYLSSVAPSGVADYSAKYIQEDEKWHFICRVFVTSKGNYFYQYIRSDNTTAFVIVDREMVQTLLRECESTAEFKYFLKEVGRNGEWIPKSGTYTKKTFKTERYVRENDEFIESYDIIDQQLYDNIIEEL